MGEVFLYKQGIQVPVEQQYSQKLPGLIRFIRISDIVSSNEPPRFINYHGTNLIKPDDLFMVRYGNPGMISMGYSGVIANNLFRLIPKKNIYTLFFYFLLIFENKRLNSLVSNTTMPALSFKALDTFYVNFPEKLSEQKVIGSLLKKLDSLITLQQRKLEILIKLKRSFLTKSMVNSLDKNPELYFNSASVKWLKQKLSDLTIKEFKGNTKLNDTKPGKTEYLDAERLNGNVPLFIDKPINTLKSDILILWDGSKAGSVYYGFEGSLGSTLKAIRLNPKLVNSFFVYQQLKSKQDVIFNKYRTPNIPHVIKNFTKVYPIYFPSMAVQNKIARFLGNLDTLIEIQQKSIKDHKVIKKYLLQKLFI